MTAAVDARDTLLPLSQTLHATPSSHVLLVGAGVSVASSVPSAWGVLTHLIRDIAAARRHTFPEVTSGFEFGEAEVAWYEQTFATEPTYESVLEHLGTTRTERQRLLRRFFEATEEDRETGAKEPNAAHRAVAELVKSGHIRIVITLNFDTLIEQALREVGIHPTVVSSTSELQGMAPLHTHDALVVHLHGNYLAPATMRNTTDELGTYDEPERHFLERVFTDHGVIIAGWSATYDPRLRDLLAATRCPHFASYWIEPNQQSAEAEQLRFGRGITLVHADAEVALGVLSDAVGALADTSTRSSLTVPVAVAIAKRELAGDRVAIRLHDTLNAEIARVRAIPGLDQAAAGTLPEPSYRALLKLVETESAVSTALVATAAMWGDDRSDDWIVAEVERTTRSIPANGTINVLRLPQLPALLWSAAAAIAAVHAGRWGLVRRLMFDMEIQLPGDERGPVATALTTQSLYIPAQPTTLYLFDLLEPLFVQHLGLTNASWVDAWETVELLRMIAPLATHKRNLVTGATERVWATIHGSNPPDPHTWSEAVADLATHVRVRPAHLRVQDINYDDNYPPVAGVRLLAALRASGMGHPMVQAEVLGKGTISPELVIEAANNRLARTGEKVAWAPAVNGMAEIKTYFWLDTFETPGREV